MLDFITPSKQRVKVVTADENKFLTDTEINIALDTLRKKNHSIEKINYIRSDSGRLVTVVIEYIA